MMTKWVSKIHPKNMGSDYRSDNAKLQYSGMELRNDEYVYQHKK
jgi:hypothetical protein